MTVFTTLHFLRNLQLGPISWSVTLHYVGDKPSSLLGLFVGYEVNASVVNTTSRTVFTTLHFLCNLQLGPISWSVTLNHYVRDKPSSLLGPFVSYEVNESVVNTTSRTVFKTLHFLRNLQLGPISWSVTLHYAGDKPSSLLSPNL